MPTQTSPSITRVQRERLAAIHQYLYDYILAPVKHGSATMPLQPWETVQEIERLLDRADQQLARVNRTCVGGDRVLHEAPPPNDLCAQRAREAFCDPRPKEEAADAE